MLRGVCRSNQVLYSPFFQKLFADCWHEFFTSDFEEKVLTHVLFENLWTRERTHYILINALMHMLCFVSFILKGDKLIFAQQQDSQNSICSFPVKPIPVEKFFERMRSVILKFSIHMCQSSILFCGILLQGNIQTVFLNSFKTGFPIDVVHSFQCWVCIEQPLSSSFPSITRFLVSPGTIKTPVKTTCLLLIFPHEQQKAFHCFQMLPRKIQNECHQIQCSPRPYVLCSSSSKQIWDSTVH